MGVKQASGERKRDAKQEGVRDERKDGRTSRRSEEGQVLHLWVKCARSH